jgi:pimeloyl-ACP methyl ester carboxylesterase
VALEYAVRHPERVSGLVLFGGFARGWRLSSSPKLVAGIEAMMVLMRQGWGVDNPAFRQIFTSLFLPRATAEQADWMNAMQRMTTSPEQAARLLESFGWLDVRDRLARVSVPTLVLHGRDDRFVPASLGRQIAAAIPGARFVSLPSGNHLILEDEPAFALLTAEIDAFLAGLD